MGANFEKRMLCYGEPQHQKWPWNHTLSHHQEGVWPTTDPRRLLQKRFPIAFIETPCGHCRRLVQAPEAEPGSTFWSPESVSRRGCQSCVLMIWHQSKAVNYTIYVRPPPHNCHAILPAFDVVLPQWLGVNAASHWKTMTYVMIQAYRMTNRELPSNEIEGKLQAVHS